MPRQARSSREPTSKPTDDRYVVNRGGARDQLFAQIRNEATTNGSDFLSRVKFVSPGEEMYARTAVGAFDHWQVFQKPNPSGTGTVPMTPAEKLARMRVLLEENTAALKVYFPGIPTLHVENRYDDAWPPPPSLDVMGVDGYPFWGNGNCDGAQRAIFQAQTVDVVDRALQFGKPVMLVAGAFEQIPWIMPSPCQLSWIQNFVRFTPGIVGVQWFTWASYPTLSPPMRGLNETGFSPQYQSTLHFGREILGTVTPTPITLPPTIASFMKTARIACAASGPGDRFVTYTSGTQFSCEQACAAVKCATRARCVKGWALWAYESAYAYQYPNACTSADPSGGQNPSGKACCCTDTGCAQPTEIEGTI